MKKIAATLLASFAFLPQAHAAEPEQCRTPAFSDVGWTDITATTATAAMVLEALGYKPEIQVLSVAVTFESLRKGDTDIFLGNWMPLQEPIQKPLVEAGDIEVVRANLEGALIGFAVPATTYEAGLKTFADIAGFKDRLGGKIYGIESGSSANTTILKTIEDNGFDLSGFELVESSEQGMLAQVERAIRAKDDLRQRPSTLTGAARGSGWNFRSGIRRCRHERAHSYRRGRSPDPALSARGARNRGACGFGGCNGSRGDCARRA